MNSVNEFLSVSRHFLKLLAIAAILVGASADGISAQNTPADSVSANGTPSRWAHSSCQATLSQLSDGSISNPGICFLAPLDPSYQQTYTFTPANDEFMTGINIWANAGQNMGDNELRRLDVEVDYFDPTTNSTATLSLNNVNIGDTANFDDPKFVSFGGPGLYRVSEVRIDDLVGLSTTGRVVYREVQGFLVILPVAPEIGIVSSESGNVADGGDDPQGTHTSGAPSILTYTVTNTGTDTLTFGGTPAVMNETNISGPVIVGAPGSLALAPGESTTFDVRYTPAEGGAFGFDIDVLSNDPDELIYDIAVSGTANEVPGVSLAALPSPLAGPFAVTATFTEPVNNFVLADFNVSNGVASSFANPASGVYIISVTPTDLTQPVTVNVPASVATDAEGEPNSASNTLNFIVVNALTPTELSAIEDIILEETERDLRNAIAMNQRAVRNAYDRHAEYLRCRAIDTYDLNRTDGDLEGLNGCTALRGLSIEPIFDGKLTVTEKSVAGSALFFTQKSSIDGRSSRLAFGELSFNRYDDGDTNASVNGRIAWERVVNEDVLRGLFIGAGATRSNIDDAFSGSRTGYSLNAGAYFVDQLSENLFWDGFVSVGFGRNNLDLGNGSIDVNGDYDTTSLQLGLAITGAQEYESFDLYPELSLAYGVTSVGDADLVSTSITETTKDTILANNISLATIRFRPEFVFRGDINDFGVAEHNFSVAPSLLCEHLQTDTSKTNCGGGLEIEWSLASEDGLSDFSARANREVVGGAVRDQLSISYERRF